MIRLLYCSESTLGHVHAIDAIATIVEAANIKNAKIGITGALIFTGDHFAQALEGEDDAVEDLMNAIRADPRHCSVTEVHRDNVRERRFVKWAMAYRGRTTHAEGPIEKLIKARSEEPKIREIGRVYDVMTDFAG